MKTLKQYISELSKIAESNPEALDFMVVTSIDDEGNGWNAIHYDPSIGFFEDGEFYSDMDDNNAVCVN